MNKKVLFAASSAIVAFSTPAFAADDHACVNEACTLVSLFAQGDSAGSSAALPAQRYGTWGIDMAGMDPSVRPGASFFDYVNGNWARTTQIPADRSTYRISNILADLNESRLRQLIQSYAPGNPETDGDSAKVAALYNTFLDEGRIESLGSQPLQSMLASIRTVSSREAIAETMGRSFGDFGRSFFNSFVDADLRDPEKYILYLTQGGLGLSDRSFYLEERFAEQKARYRDYVEQMLTLAGWENPKASADAILALETRIAGAHWTREESRVPDKTYNLMTLDDLEREAPGFPWRRFFSAAGIASDRAVARQNTAFPAIARIFAETDLDTLKAWQAFSVTDNAAGFLSSAFADAQFEFRSKFLNGQQEQRDRWKLALTFTEDAMGEAIGRDYVALYFPEDSRVKMNELVANLRVAMRSRLENLTWMSEATKREALAKLETFNVKIGHPETWQDYAGLQVVNGDLFGNARRSSSFNWDIQRVRIGQPVDPDDWGLTPQTVNAYYSPPRNEIVFPAAILQPPFFDPDADPAVNYGGIGGVIGHEIIHGFDDQGRKSDGNGVLRDWWTAEDAAAFEVQAARLGAQYESYTFPTLPEMRISGRLSMGENIGDLGGLTIAYEAFRSSLGGREAPLIDGFTGDQRFFLGWAQVWRSLYRDDTLRQRLVNGPHSPDFIRAFAPLRNIDAWYEAFGVTPSDPHYIAPEDRVRIW